MTPKKTTSCSLGVGDPENLAKNLDNMKLEPAERVLKFVEDAAKVRQTINYW